MKIPSLTRIPKYKRFNITPRYYDPIKEDIQNRTERIQQELRLQQGNDIRSGLQKDFLRTQRQNRQSTVIQLVIVALLIATAVGYFLYGNAVFYFFLILVPFYIFFRRKSYYRSRQ